MQLCIIIIPSIGHNLFWLSLLSARTSSQSKVSSLEHSCGSFPHMGYLQWSLPATCSELSLLHISVLCLVHSYIYLFLTHVCVLCVFVIYQCMCSNRRRVLKLWPYSVRVTGTLTQILAWNPHLRHDFAHLSWIYLQVIRQNLFFIFIYNTFSLFSLMLFSVSLSQPSVTQRIKKLFSKLF